MNYLENNFINHIKDFSMLLHCNIDLLKDGKLGLKNLQGSFLSTNLDGTVVWNKKTLGTRETFTIKILSNEQVC